MARQEETQSAVAPSPDLAAAIMALAQSMQVQAQTHAAEQTRMADMMALLQANQMPREIKEGDPEYTARLHAEGLYDEFEKPVYQNAYQAQARGLSAQVRERASRLKPGHYLKGRVRVDVDGHGGVYLNYPTKQPDDRMKNMALFTSFEDLIEKIWAEMHAPKPVAS